MKLTATLFVVLLSCAPALAQAADSGKHAGKEVTLTGEVMDLACYFQHPATGQGAEHASCARQCINKNMPAGLKVGGQLYLLMGQGHDPVAPLVAEYAGKQTTITGKLIEQDGMRAIVVATAKEAKAAK